MSENSDRDYIDLVANFTEYKIAQRLEAIKKRATAFIESLDFSTEAYVSVPHLEDALLDYFSDIQRLKSFQEIKKVNAIKIMAYTAYWLLRRKIIQVKPCERNDFNIKELSYINEKFVQAWLIDELKSYLPSRNNSDESKIFDNFVGLMGYFFTYRQYSAQDIELMITAFLAGSDAVVKNDSERLSSLVESADVKGR